MSTPHKEKLIRVLQVRNWKKNMEWKMYTVHPFMTMCVCCKAAVIRLSRQKIHIKDGIWRNICWKTGKLRLMLDSVQQARCVSVHEANEIRNKLLNLTSQRGRSRFSHMIMPLPGNVRGVGQIGEYIEIMLEAMYLHKKIQFQYTEINNAMEKVLRKEGKMYQLNLYTIYWSDNNYYLIGSHDNHDGLTNYRLDRIENMSMSSEETIPAEEKIGVNPELVIQDYIKKSVNHFSGNTIRIEVEYKPAPITMLYYMILQGRE